MNDKLLLRKIASILSSTPKHMCTILEQDIQTLLLSNGYLEEKKNTYGLYKVVKKSR